MPDSKGSPRRDSGARPVDGEIDRLLDEFIARANRTASTAVEPAGRRHHPGVGVGIAVAVIAGGIAAFFVARPLLGGAAKPAPLPEIEVVLPAPPPTPLPKTHVEIPVQAGPTEIAPTPDVTHRAATRVVKHPTRRRAARDAAATTVRPTAPVQEAPPAEAPAAAPEEEGTTPEVDPAPLPPSPSDAI